MAPGLAGWLREGSAPKRAEGKNKNLFFLFFVECGRGVSQGSRELIPVQMARGGGLRGKNTPQLGHPTLKNPLFSSGKQAFLQNRSFASKDGWGRLLRPLLDVLEPLEGARGSGSTHLVATWGHLGAVGPLIWWEQFGSMGLSNKQ